MNAGLKLKKVREGLNLRYREVEEASNLIAKRRRNSDFAIGLSRLADIENKGVVPNIHRLYSLCAIYRLDLEEVLSWYDVPLDEIWSDALQAKPSKTHLIGMRQSERGTVTLPLRLDPGIDLNETVYLSRAIQEWGPVPLSILSGLGFAQRRFGFIGWEDHRMSPLIPAGSLVQIDDSRTKIATGGWSNDFERPIYFLEMRDGFACCWCSLAGERLILQPHTSSGAAPEILNYPQDVDVIGQVTGYAVQIRIVSDPGPTAKVASATRSTRPTTAPE